MYCIYEAGTNKLTRGSNNQTFCHETESAAQRQARAINASKEDKAHHEEEYKSFQQMVEEFHKGINIE